VLSLQFKRVINLPNKAFEKYLALRAKTLKADVGEKKMKRFFTITASLIAVTALAMVSPGRAQKITVIRDAKQELLFKVDDGKSFADVDPCAKHCYKRSWFTNENSEWANLVSIHVAIPMSAENRQYIGDRFVANRVYPHDITWIQDGVTNKIVYKPDDKSFRKERRLK